MAVKLQADENKRISSKIAKRYRNYTKEIEIEEGAEVIGQNAFDGYKNLERIHLPKSLRIIEQDAFTGCNFLKEIELNDGLIRIDDNAFGYCDIEKIYISKSVETIGARPLFDNQNLKEIIIDKDNPRYSDCGCNVIYDKKENKIIQGCSNSKIPEDTQVIGIYAFSRYNIKNLTLPNSVTKIEDYAFFECMLEEIKLNENLKYIYEGAFQNNKLKELIVPSSVELIDLFAFKGCDLRKIIIEKNTEIHAGVFKHNPNLKDIYIYCDDKDCLVSSRMTDNKETNIYLKEPLDSELFYRAYKDQIKPFTLDILIEQGKSFKEANDILKNKDEER